MIHVALNRSQIDDVNRNYTQVLTRPARKCSAARPVLFCTRPPTPLPTPIKKKQHNKTKQKQTKNLPPLLMQ